ASPWRLCSARSWSAAPSEPGVAAATRLDAVDGIAGRGPVPHPAAKALRAACPFSTVPDRKIVPAALDGTAQIMPSPRGSAAVLPQASAARPQSYEQAPASHSPLRSVARDGSM